MVSPRASLLTVGTMFSAAVSNVTGFLRPSTTTTTRNVVRTFASTSDKITSSPLPGFGNPTFGITKRLPGVSFDEAMESVEGELKKVGFGVITKIDMRETMKKKLDIDLGSPYVILGACNPKLAHQALTKMPAVGLLLPCNIVVAQETPDDAETPGPIVVSALSPEALFAVAKNDETENDLLPLANEVQGLIQTAIDAL